jgi:hypothetical protein
VDLALICLALASQFALHGRLSDKAAMDGFCRAAWAESHAAGAERKLLVINLEQRNHGTREVVRPMSCASAFEQLR